MVNVVVLQSKIIYLMKKYNWCLNKCIQYITSKKQDINIPQYFIEQLFNYEIRLSKQIKYKSVNWTDFSNKNGDEIILRNTYINGLSMNEMQGLLDDLMRIENPYVCPHGRPTMIYYSSYELEKLFKRVV